MTTLGSDCPQCGIMHPPLPAGQICPMAKQVTSSGTQIDYNGFLNQLKNICMSQIESKQIKDHEKLFTHVIINVTRELESYQE